MAKPVIGFERGIDPNHYVIKLDKARGGVVFNQPDGLVIDVERPYEGSLPDIERAIAEFPPYVGRYYLPRAAVYVDGALRQSNVFIGKPRPPVEEQAKQAI